MGRRWRRDRTGRVMAPGPRPGREPGRARRCHWPPCRSVPRSGPSSTGCSRRPTSPPPNWRASWRARGRGPVAPRRRYRRPRPSWWPGCERALRTPLGPVLGDLRLAESAARTASTSSASSSRWPAAMSPRGRSDSRQIAADCCAPSARWRSAASLRRAAGRRRAAPERARLSDRQPRPGRAAARLRRPRGSPCSTTRRTGSGRSMQPLTAPSTTGPAASRTRCSATTTCCRRSSTWSPCTATCAGGCPAMIRRQASPGSAYLFLRGMTGPEGRSSGGRASRAGVHLATGAGPGRPR